MNLAVHGLAGDIREANSYYEDLHEAPGSFDFVMANPPFNVDRVDKERLKDDTARFPFGMPTTDNANYLWIQLFYSRLNESGRAGFVMANSAGDARGSELEIRKQLIQSRRGGRDRLRSAPTSSTPSRCPARSGSSTGARPRPRAPTRCCSSTPGTSTARSTAPTATSRPSRSSSWPTSSGSTAARSRRAMKGSDALMAEQFPDGAYRDVPGLCKVARRSPRSRRRAGA